MSYSSWLRQKSRDIFCVCYSSHIDEIHSMCGKPMRSELRGVELYKMAALLKEGVTVLFLSHGWDHRSWARCLNGRSQAELVWCRAALLLSCAAWIGSRTMLLPSEMSRTDYSFLVCSQTMLLLLVVSRECWLSSQPKVLTEGWDLHEAQVDIPLSVSHSSIWPHRWAL